MPVNLLQIVLGLLLMYLGYTISKKTGSEQIVIMGYIVLVIGLVLTVSGIGIISLPFLGNSTTTT